MEKFNAKLFYMGYYGRGLALANRVRPLKTRADLRGLKMRCNLPTAGAAIGARAQFPPRIKLQKVPQ